MPISKVLFRSLKSRHSETAFLGSAVNLVEAIVYTWSSDEAEALPLDHVTLMDPNSSFQEITRSELSPA